MFEIYGRIKYSMNWEIINIDNVIDARIYSFLYSFHFPSNIHPISTTIKCNLVAFYQRWLTLNPSRVGKLLYLVIRTIVIPIIIIVVVVCTTSFVCITSVSWEEKTFILTRKLFFFLGKCNVIILYILGMKGHCDTECICDKIHVC